MRVQSRLSRLQQKVVITTNPNIITSKLLTMSPTIASQMADKHRQSVNPIKLPGITEWRIKLIHRK